MAEIKNHDIIGIYDRMNRFIVEMNKAVSADVSDVISFDQARLASYLDAIDRLRIWIVAQPQQDFTESTEMVFTLEAEPDVVNVENESINDVIRMMTLARTDLINSQSARKPSGLDPADATRLTAFVEKIRTFLNEYIIPTVPLDLPQSSPMEGRTGAGKRGT